jgi:hypothetical protein
MTDVAAVAASRGITRIMHFTTNSGLVGILASRAVKARERLPEEKYVEHVYKPNALFRRDPDHLDYVNLSIECINGRFFHICSTRWHRGEDRWWCILSFGSDILSHDGVLFTTTNNMYTAVQRAAGAAGLEALFAPRIHQYEERWVTREPSLDAKFPTCPQAEVLYPGQLNTQALQEIYVSRPEDGDVVAAQLNILPHPGVRITVAPDFASVRRS